MKSAVIEDIVLEMMIAANCRTPSSTWNWIRRGCRIRGNIEPRTDITLNEVYTAFHSLREKGLIA